MDRASFTTHGSSRYHLVLCDRRLSLTISCESLSGLKIMKASRSEMEMSVIQSGDLHFGGGNACRCVQGLC
jgi:hypothetical protein